MEREIKFRGKRIDNGEWVGGFLIANDEIRVFEEDNSVGLLTHEDFEIDPKTIGQYTGLKDKNGKEIFEGDVLQNCLIKKSLGVMEWESKNARWTMFAPFDQFEVIGNIFDNPELIGGKQ